jgi:hypothetical protein
MENSIINAIISINPNAEVSVSADDIDTIVWENGTTPIAEADILAKQKELQAEYDAKEYQRDRAVAYPSMAEQLDDIYHNGVDEWKKTIKAVKDKYPKE